MKYFLPFLLVISLISPTVTADCQISDKNRFFVGAFQEIGNQIYQIPETTRLTLDIDSFIYLICPGGFDSSKISPKSETYAIKVKCEENGLTSYGSFYQEDLFPIESYHESYTFSSQYQLETTATTFSYGCTKRTLNIFKGNNEESYCEHASYAVGYQLGDKVIILMELCFNPIDKKLDFIHFLLSPKRHPISEMYNPVNSTENNFASLPVAEFFGSSENSLQNIKNAPKGLFSTNSLVDFTLFLPFQYPSFSHLKRITNVIWLKNVKEGQTCKMFYELLGKRKEKVQYNVLTGTSGKISEKSLDTCTNEEIRNEVNIPEYIWTYLRSHDESVGEDFVVIYINSPYVEYARWNETIFCEDICNTIEWLTPLEEIRHMPYMGYMFCCNATQDVKEFLDGFPNI